MVDIIHRVGIKAPISKVYAALSAVEGHRRLVDKRDVRLIQNWGNDRGSVSFLQMEKK